MGYEDRNLRHVVLYAKGWYIRKNIKSDLLRIIQFVNSLATETSHIIMVLAPLLWIAMKDSRTIDVREPNAERDDLYEAWKDQWVFMASLREKFEVHWLEYPRFHELSDEQKETLQEIFQEEFDKRVLEAFITPFVGWMKADVIAHGIDIGDPDRGVLPVANPNEKEERNGRK